MYCGIYNNRNVCLFRVSCVRFEAARSRKQESLVVLSKKAHTHNNILHENIRLKRTVVQTDLSSEGSCGRRQASVAHWRAALRLSQSFVFFRLWHPHCGGLCISEFLLFLVISAVPASVQPSACRDHFVFFGLWHLASSFWRSLYL